VFALDMQAAPPLTRVAPAIEQLQNVEYLISTCPSKKKKRAPPF
jgi:hypothetical protein